MNYITHKLSKHASAQCVIREYRNGDLVLQSYNTDVIYYKHDNMSVYCSGTYSNTTARQISWFCQEWLNITYKECKECYYQDKRVKNWRQSNPQYHDLTDGEKQAVGYMRYNRVDPDNWELWTEGETVRD